VILSIVIPAYNEARRIGPTLTQIGQYLAQRGQPAEILVVDDGSTDETARVVVSHLAALRDAGLAARVIRLAKQRGKGAALRAGILEAQGERILLCDADLSVPIEAVETLETALADAAVVIASRDLPDSRLDPPQPWPRRIGAWVFRAIRRRWLLPQIRDTQCGFKLLRRDAARAAVAHCRLDGWLFDCELLAMAAGLGHAIREVAVLWRNDPATHVRPLATALTAVPQLRDIARRAARLRPNC
jgi:dolichyl-phosphate beta-glucosyltransferase